jgi:hypothetical protein
LIPIKPNGSDVMLRSTLTITLMLAATTATAGDGARLCDMRLVADVELTPTQLIVDDGARRHVIEDGRVLRDGRELALDAGRAQLVRDYTDGMQQLVPAVSDVALRGALLGLESLALVSAGLSGDDATISRATARIETLATELHLQFDSRRLPAGALALDVAFEREIGTLAADAACQFASSLLSFIGTALFDADTASARGAYLERLVERRIEPRATQIEAQADQLCSALRQLDALETQLDLFDAITDGRDEQAI